MAKKLTYIDLFAGAGGLSEGFIKAGYNPIAHVEIEQAACYTLQTRIAYHSLNKNKKIDHYHDYLKGEINRHDLYSLIPKHELESVINLPIGNEHNKQIFGAIDYQLQNQEVDLIIGGPPCQAYSLVGRSRDEYNMRYDDRNYLYMQYGKYLKRYNPKMFVFENVLGLKSAGKGKYFRSMLAMFDKLGYEVADSILEADKFDVLQKRKRVILVGYKKELNLTIPDFRLPKTETYFVKDIFEDLPQLNAGEGVDKYTTYKKKTNPYLEEKGIRNGINILTQHVGRPHTEQDKEIYRIAVDMWNEKKQRLSYETLPSRLKTHSNRHSFFDRFKVVASDLYSSQTVVAHISKDGHYYIHPDVDQNRSITVREAARLQSFPDNYYFEGVKEGKNRTAAFKQIGNAVPPLMANRIADKIKELL